jgi:DNA processing protein
MTKASLLLKLAIHRMEFASAAEKRSLQKAVGDEQVFQALTLDAVSVIIGRRLRVRTFDTDLLLAQAEEDIRVLDRRGVVTLFLGDPDYPRPTDEIYDPPYALFVLGALGVDAPRVAVVGTRSPSVEGASAAGRLGHGLAREGVSVVSGLARGIDTMAHRGAVAAGGGHVAVLGSGIDFIYPKQNRSLAQRILDKGGAIVSEYPPGVPPTKYHFPERTRIISGLSLGVVVAQAPAHSGALITADFALEQGRDLLVHRSGLRGKAGAGTAHLAEEGAPVVQDAQDVMQLVGVSATPPRRRQPRRLVPQMQSRAAGRQLGLELIAEMEDASGDRRSEAIRTEESPNG